MRRITAVACVAAFCAAPAFAALSQVDTDGDGLASFEELLVAYPGLEDTVFAEIDTDADGMLNEAELTAAIEAARLVPAAQ